MKNTIKKTAKHSLLAVVSLFYFSCISNIQPLEESTPLPTSGNIPITISGRILQVQAHTRITDNKFDNDNAIGLYVLAQPENLSGSRHIDNMRLVYSSDVFTPEEEIYYPKGEGKCDFISYYPYQEEGIIQGSSNININVSPDQSSTTEYSNSDFMVTKATGISPSLKAVNLQYNHKLCQLNIILQVYEEENINELQQNASISISNLNTKATYNMDTELFSAFNTPQSIIPNGKWEIDEESHQLTGKKVILIPQPITPDCELTLRVNNKVYCASMPTDLILESEAGCELLLRYDSRVGIGGITTSISDWKPGSSSSTDLEEKVDNSSITISDLNFEKTGIYNLITSSDIVIGEICKEYLLGDNIDAQAIVLYPTNNSNKGTVLQILGETQSIHGGNINWDKTNNSFTYIAGDKTPIEQIYADEDGNITFEKSEDVQLIQAKESMLTDIRGAETNIYPIVKIGTQYWMQENLKTTKYNDATAITNNTASLAKTTAGYYLKNSNYFYNQTAIITGKMSPQGWKIPDTAEWEKLKNYIRDEAATLKSGVWTIEEGADKANNKTGFNGKPVGIYTKKDKMDESGYGHEGKYVGYWTLQENQTILNETTTSLSYKLNNTGEFKNSDYCAYSIRCLKE
ncbi:fimbrillin family protein [Bacteroides nordii]|uniref:fimbrillin family protein n=1 Tax=Bacteroides nordii TaxID=291645 RepID=UPI00203FDF88|nr:fimbrillin family protein [Bacteroides nordii]GFZ38753.1 hypothetical protein BANORC5_07880 [Bacteroides nordii]